MGRARSTATRKLTLTAALFALLVIGAISWISATDTGPAGSGSALGTRLIDGAKSLTQTVSASESSLLIKEVDTSDFPRVTVRVAAVNSKHQPVRGLRPGDFKVQENGLQPAQLRVRSVKTDDTSVAAILAIDVSGGRAPTAMESAKAAATTFINSLGPGDQAALVTFSSNVRIVQGLTKDKSLILEALGRLRPGGTTALYDGLLTAVQTAVSRGPGHNIVVLHAEGSDTHSQSRLEDALQLARQERVPVYAVGLGPEVDQRALRQIAGPTGGWAFAAATKDQLELAYLDLSDELRHQYLLHYVSPGPRGAETYRLQVQVNQWFRGGSSEVSFPAKAPAPIIDLGVTDETPPIDSSVLSFEASDVPPVVISRPAADRGWLGAGLASAALLPWSLWREVEARLSFSAAIPTVINVYERMAQDTVASSIQTLLLVPFGLFHEVQGRLLFLGAIPDVVSASRRTLLALLLLPIAARVAVAQGRRVAQLAHQRREDSSCPDCGGSIAAGHECACRRADVTAAERTQNLGDLLVENGLLSRETLGGYVEQSREQRRPLSNILREAGAVRSDLLGEAEFYLMRSAAMAARQRADLQPNRQRAVLQRNKVRPWWATWSLLPSATGLFFALCACGITIPLLLG